MCSSDLTNLNQTVLFVLDDCSLEVTSFIENIIKRNSCKGLHFEIFYITNGTIRKSIEKTYDYLLSNDSDLVYQVQDDYLFYETSILEMIDIFMQVRQSCLTDSIVSSFNAPSLWTESYKNVSTPRMIVPGIKRYWIQTFDITCTFLTSKNQFKNHVDLYQKFFEVLPHGIDGSLESISLNKILTERGILGLLPINSVAFHLQSNRELDVYQDWKSLWESNKV